MGTLKIIQLYFACSYSLTCGLLTCSGFVELELWVNLTIRQLFPNPLSNYPNGTLTHTSRGKNARQVLKLELPNVFVSHFMSHRPFVFPLQRSCYGAEFWISKVYILQSFLLVHCVIASGSYIRD